GRARRYGLHRPIDGQRTPFRHAGGEQYTADAGVPGRDHRLTAHDAMAHSHPCERLAPATLLDHAPKSFPWTPRSFSSVLEASAGEESSRDRPTILFSWRSSLFSTSESPARGELVTRPNAAPSPDPPTPALAGRPQ